MPRGIFKDPIARAKKLSDSHKQRGTVPPSRMGCKPSDKAIKLSAERWTGEGNPNYGKHPEPWNKGVHVGTTWNKGLVGTISEETRKKMSDAAIGRLTGERHHKWRGGVSKEYKEGYWSTQYKQWIKSVFERDGFACQKCGAKGVVLNAHHKKQWAEFPELRFDIENGITYCLDCHKAEHFYKERKAT